MQLLLLAMNGELYWFFFLLKSTCSQGIVIPNVEKSFFNYTLIQLGLQH